MIASPTVFPQCLRRNAVSLTPVEAQVMDLLLQGLSNKEIASTRS
jgi:DNA-binding CsgD family transcriptional regulator